MRLYLKRDKSADKYDFVFYDELGKEKYRAYFYRGKVAPRFTMTIETPAGAAAAKIRMLPLVGVRAFVLRAGKGHVTLVVVPTQKGIYSYFYGNNWHISGDLATKNFNIIDVDKSVILSNTRRPDCCLLEISNPDNELYCVAASICANLINTIEKKTLQPIGS